MWQKANPNLGVTVSYDTYQRDVERAENAPAARNDILAKRFGLPMEGYTYYFTYEETLPHRKREYWQMPCSLGADLSRGDDFCDFSFLFPLSGGAFGVHILKDIMMPVISEPRKEISKYAPKIINTKIGVDKIKDVIGPGGKMINKIIDETGVKIDIEEDGTVFIYATENANGPRALEMIEDIAREIEVGKVYKAIVEKIVPFGAFVSLGGGKEGLIHISKITKERVEHVEDFLKVGQEVMVKVIQIDDQGKINLTMRFEEEEEKVVEE